jgi:hypothetical protein
MAKRTLYQQTKLQFLKEITSDVQYKRGRYNWIGHILHKNGLLKVIIERKIKENIFVAGTQEIIRKQLLDDLKEKRRYCKVKEEALDRTVWGTFF